MSKKDDVHKVMLTFDERIRKLESLVDSIKIQKNPQEVGTQLDRDFQKLMSKLNQINHSRQVLIQDHMYDYEYKKNPTLSTSAASQNISPIPASKDVNNETRNTIPSFQRTQEPDLDQGEGRQLLENEDEESEGEQEDGEEEEEWTLRERRLWSPKRKEVTVSPPKRKMRKAQPNEEEAVPARPFDFAKEVQHIITDCDLATSKFISSAAPTIPRGWGRDEEGKKKIHYLRQKRIRPEKTRKKKKKSSQHTLNKNNISWSAGTKHQQQQISQGKSHSFTSGRRKSEWKKIVSPTKPLPLGLYAANTMSFEAKRNYDNFRDDGRSKKLLLTNMYKDHEREAEKTRRRILSKMRKNRKKRFISYSSVRHLTGDHSKMDNVDYYLNLCSTKYSKNQADQEKKIFVRWAGQRNRKDDRQVKQ